MHNTHAHRPRIGQFSSIDAPTLLFTAKPTNTAQTYPSVTLAAAYPKPKKVHYKIKLQRSNATKSPSRTLCPSPMAFPYGNHHQPPTVIDRHKTTHDQVFWRLHLLFNVFLSKGSSVFLPKSESRLSGLTPLAVTYRYASMSMQLDSEMCGRASGVSLGCCCAVFGT